MGNSKKIDFIRFHNTVFHFSITTALLNNLLDGTFSIGEIKKYGDFGLCTYNALDGEGIILDNHFYKIKGDGKVYNTNEVDLVPFGIITTFNSDKEIVLTDSLNYKSFKKYIDPLLPTKNIIYAIKIKAHFKWIKVRSVHKQTKPYRSQEEIHNETVKYEYSDITGTLVGFKSPDFTEGISVPGYHFHFIDSDKKVGGHLLDFEIESGRVEIDFKHNFHVMLERSKEFYNLEIAESKNDLLQKTENS